MSKSIIIDSFLFPSNRVELAPSNFYHYDTAHLFYKVNLIPKLLSTLRCGITIPDILGFRTIKFSNTYLW